MGNSLLFWCFVTFSYEIYRNKHYREKVATSKISSELTETTYFHQTCETLAILLKTVLQLKMNHILSTSVVWKHFFQKLNKTPHFGLKRGHLKMKLTYIINTDIDIYHIWESTAIQNFPSPKHFPSMSLFETKKFQVFYSRWLPMDTEVVETREQVIQLQYCHSVGFYPNCLDFWPVNFLMDFINKCLDFSTLENCLTFHAHQTMCSLFQYLYLWY